MEAKILTPLISALVGALIGAFASIMTIWIQQRAQSKREKIKLACEMAKEEHKLARDLAKDRPNGAKIFPVSIYQHFNYEILTALESGKLNKKELIKIKLKNKELMVALENYYSNP